MRMYDTKTDEQVAESGRSEHVFCNPQKAKFADEDRSDALSELRDRGYSQHEAESMVDDD